jgi:hypothetical protein
VSKALAVPPGQGQYGIRVAPTFSNPLLILAATVAMDRYAPTSSLRLVRPCLMEETTESTT